MKRNVTVTCTACGSRMTGWVDDTDPHRPIEIGVWRCRCTKDKGEES